MAGLAKTLIPWLALFLLAWALGRLVGHVRSASAGAAEWHAGYSAAEAELIRRTGLDVNEWEKAKRAADKLLMDHKLLLAKPGGLDDGL